jgi:hypothetical protein
MERRWELWTLYRLSKLPQRPSDLIGLREAGHSDRDCLAFDLMTLEFGERFERATQETVERPLPNERRRPTIPVPKYAPADLERFLGLGDSAIANSSDPPDREELERMVNDLLRGSASWLS